MAETPASPYFLSTPGPAYSNLSSPSSSSSTSIIIISKNDSADKACLPSSIPACTVFPLLEGTAAIHFERLYSWIVRWDDHCPRFSWLAFTHTSTVSPATNFGSGIHFYWRMRNSFRLLCSSDWDWNSLCSMVRGFFCSRLVKPRAILKAGRTELWYRSLLVLAIWKQPATATFDCQ